MYDEGLSKYSIALYEVQKASGDDLLDYLDDVREAYKDKAFLTALSHPKLRPEQKHALIKKVFGDTLPEPLFNLLYVVADHGRSNRLVRILDAYEDMCYEAKNIERIVVVAPMPLSDEKVEAIRKAYGKNCQGQVEVKVEIDPSLIGGVKIITEDGVIDRSLSRQLEDLGRSLRRNA